MYTRSWEIEVRPAPPGSASLPSEFMTEPLPAKDIAKLSFEEALAELEAIVRELESGEAKLDDAIRAYERGAALKRHCEAKLKEAEAKVERIQLTADGKVEVKPEDID
jgi:exodeoxyribonuclease VII small subunit